MPAAQLLLRGCCQFARARPARPVPTTTAQTTRPPCTVPRPHGPSSQHGRSFPHGGTARPPRTVFPPGTVARPVPLARWQARSPHTGRPPRTACPPGHDGRSVLPSLRHIKSSLHRGTANSSTEARHLLPALSSSHGGTSVCSVLPILRLTNRSPQHLVPLQQHLPTFLAIFFDCTDEHLKILCCMVKLFC